MAVGVEHRGTDVAIREHVLLHDSVMGSGRHHASASPWPHRRYPKVSLVPLLQFAISQVLYLLLPEHLLVLGDSTAHQTRRGRQLRAPDGLVLHLSRMRLLQSLLLLERGLLQHLLLVVVAAVRRLGRTGWLLPRLRRVATHHVVERPSGIILHYVLNEEALVLAAVARSECLLLDLAGHLLVCDGARMLILLCGLVLAKWATGPGGCVVCAVLLQLRAGVACRDLAVHVAHES